MAGVRLGLAIAVFGLSLNAVPALASGGFHCQILDDGVDIAIEGGTSRSVPGMPFSFAATADVALPGTPDDFRAIDLSEALAQYWNLDGDLKLRLYYEREADPFGWIDIVVETAQTDDEDEPWMFYGTYTLEIGEVPADGGDTVITDASGIAVCSVE
jgi:hypothetical protein